MSISSTANRVVYTGNGVTTAFSFPYEYFASTDLVVLATVIATGAVTTKALTADYTVTGTPDASGIYPNGGTVNMLVAPASTVKITIYRDPSPTQTTVFVDNDKLPAASINNGLDKLTIICQRLKESFLRSARLADGDLSGADVTLPAPVASKLLGWSSNGLALVNYAIADLSASVVTAYSATLLALADAASWRAALKVPVAQVVNFETGAVATGTNGFSLDDTIPQQNFTGDQYMTLAITPTNVLSTLLIDVVWFGANSTGADQIVALFQDSIANARAAGLIVPTSANARTGMSFRHKMSAGTLSSTTFKVRSGANASTTTFNGTAAGRLLGGTMASSITITEILP